MVERQRAGLHEIINCEVLSKYASLTPVTNLITSCKVGDALSLHGATHGRVSIPSHQLIPKPILDPHIMSLHNFVSSSS